MGFNSRLTQIGRVSPVPFSISRPYHSSNPLSVQYEYISFIQYYVTFEPDTTPIVAKLVYFLVDTTLCCLSRAPRPQLS